MDPGCARGLVNVSFSSVFDAIAAANPELSLFEIWVAAVSQIYLEPLDIPRQQPFSWNKATADAIAQRNPASPSLAAERFLLPRSQLRDTSGFLPDPTEVNRRPFPLVAWTLIGPDGLGAYLPANRNYSLVESSPIATGVLASRGAAVFRSLSGEASLEVEVGGLVESFAFGRGCAAAEPMPRDQPSALLSLPADCSSDGAPRTAEGGLGYLDLALTVGASSYYVGCFAASSNASTERVFIGEMPYWSPVPPSSSSPSSSSSSSLGSLTLRALPSISAATNQRSFSVGDGGGLQIDNIASLLQRKLSHIVLFCSTSVPLQPPSVWDPADPAQPLSERFVDFTIPSFFGVIAADISDETARYYDLSRSQFFSSEDWVPLAQALQAAQQKGTGIVVTRQLRTVENAFFGVEAGQAVSMTFAYTGRTGLWEQQLSPEMQALVVPPQGADNYATLVQTGPFASFPNYPTLGADLTPPQANLLADLSGWTVQQNAALFRAALGVGV